MRGDNEVVLNKLISFNFILNVNKYEFTKNALTHSLFKYNL